MTYDRVDRKNGIPKIIYFILIFGAIFMDCPTGIYFGIIGRCWLFLFIPVCFIFIILIYRQIRTNSYINNLIILVIWMFIVSLITNIVQMVELESAEYSGENIWIKSLKTLTYWIILVMYLICVLECVYDMTKKEILFPFLVAYFFLFIVLVLEVRQIPYAFTKFHYNAFWGMYERVRLTTTESSATVPLIICYGLFSIYYAWFLSKSQILKIIVLAMFLVYTITSGSKTLLFIYILNMVFLFWVNRKNIKRKWLVLVICLAVIAVVICLVLVVSLWDKMMDYAGSTGTRSIQLLAAIIHSLKYPLGNGGGAYMYSYREALYKAYIWVRNSFIGEKLRYWEILSQINSDTDKTLGVIAGSWQLALSVGITGMIYWIWFTWKYLKQFYHNYFRGGWILKIMILDVIAMWLFTTTMYNVYFMWAAILLIGLKQFITDTNEY